MPHTAVIEPTHRKVQVSRPRPMSMATLGQRMRELRMQRQLSQSDVARLLDKSKQTVSGWELGISPPQLDNLLRFVSIMGTDVSGLMDGLSEDIETNEATQRRLLAASQVLPLYSLEIAGDVMQHHTEASAERYVATVTRHPPGSLAAKITGPAMKPRFVDGDLVTFSPVTMAEPGCLVLASAGGRFVFRRFLPHTEGRVEKAVLRAINSDYPDIVMRAGDAVLGRMVEHTSLRHTD